MHGNLSTVPEAHWKDHKDRIRGKGTEPRAPDPVTTGPEVPAPGAQLFLAVTAEKGEKIFLTSSQLQMGQVTLSTAASAMVMATSKICLHFVHSNS